MRSRLIAGLVAAALVGAACSGGDDAADTSSTTSPTSTTVATTATTSAPTSTTLAETTTSSSTTTSTTLAETTTTSESILPPEGTFSPLNGLAADDVSLLDRRVIAIKIDNHPRARPQSGIDRSDLVAEILVEGGFTRFMAFFHDNDADYVGPIRSLRPTDAGVIRPTGGTLVISGGQRWIQQQVASRGIGLIGEGAGGTFRISSRAAPHNLYGDTEGLRAVADTRGYDDMFLEPPVRVTDVRPNVEDAADATSITFEWAPGNTVLWEYADGVYVRSVNGVAHETVDRDGNRTRITADHLVVVAGELGTAFPPSGGGGSGVPKTDTEAGGTAYVFIDGKVIAGTWERERIARPFILFDDKDRRIPVPPGQMWLSVFPEGRSLTWS